MVKNSRQNAYKKTRIRRNQDLSQNLDAFDWVDLWLTTDDIAVPEMIEELRTMLKTIRANNNDPNRRMCICRKCGVDYAPGYGINDMCPKCHDELCY